MTWLSPSMVDGGTSETRPMVLGRSGNSLGSSVGQTAVVSDAAVWEGEPEFA